MRTEELFQKRLKEYLGSSSTVFGEGMQKLYRSIQNAAVEHLKLISEQLPTYDLHDVTHSKEILNIIEQIIPSDAIERLSLYELFFINLAAYVHDCGMALPAWELKLLSSTEGVTGFSFNEGWEIQNDLQPPMKLVEAIKYVTDNKTLIYDDFSEVKAFIFSKHDEKDFIRDLAERLVEYQEFRNGYKEELNKCKVNDNPEGYKTFSLIVRREFVRSTHAKRSADFIENMEYKFIEDLGGNWGGALARDLSRICRAHGEDTSFVKELDTKASYFGDEFSNNQFAAMMLRMGDIIHFSYDRAPKSLFAEKMINSVVSEIHWRSKFQGLNYAFPKDESSSVVMIKFNLFCKEPDLYYFVHEYLDWVDIELKAYYSFHRQWSMSLCEGSLGRYATGFSQTVDRSDIKYDEKAFIPAEKKGFVLEQTKIISLLMGVGLYKDKDLFIRELYQNSLDACRLMVSLKKKKNEPKKGLIEFGIGSTLVDGVNKQYVYCKDNGIGMSKEVVDKYFLNIGNSYYNSQEFYRKSIKWGSEYKPVSNFGIGILSCFMVGDRIQITTVPLDPEHQERSLCFSINGPGQYLYYQQPDTIDIEEIGDHGTIVKVFLNDYENYNVDSIKDITTVLIGEGKSKYFDSHKTEYKVWKRNLLYMISRMIGEQSKEVDIAVRLDEKVERPVSWKEIFPYKALVGKDDEIEALFSTIFYMNDSYKAYRDFYRNIDKLVTLNIDVDSENFSYHTNITLPMKGIGDVDYRVLDFAQTVGKGGAVLVDGIFTNGRKVLDFLEHEERFLFTHDGYFNFNGSIRPDLSVDRTSITDIPVSIKREIEEFPNRYIEAYIDRIASFIKANEIETQSEEANLIWDYMVFKYPQMARKIIDTINNRDDIDFLLRDLSKAVGESVSVRSIIKQDTQDMPNYDSVKLDNVSSYVNLCKTCTADKVAVNNGGVLIESGTFETIELKLYHWDSLNSILPCVVETDSWDGKYGEYDLVSGLWPFVPSRLYRTICNEDVSRPLSKRGKQVSNAGNSLTGIAHLRAPLINPSFGISTLSKDPYKKNDSIVGRSENIADQFYLFELNNWLREENDRDYFLFAFITPEELSEEDEIILKDYVDNDVVYYKGVREGWSILFMGRNAKTIILPGLVKRAEIIPDEKHSFWVLNKGKEFYFLDGTIVVPRRTSNVS